MHAAVALQIVNDGNVGVIERGQGLSFRLEAGDAIRIGHKRVGQNLHRDVSSQPRVARTIDLSHPARTNAGNHFIRSKPATWPEQAR